MRIAKKLENGILVFTQKEEIEDAGLGSIAKYIYETCKVSQILISDVTSVTKNIKHGRGSVIGIGAEEMPDQEFLQEINKITTSLHLPIQPEIRQTGSSDFSRLLMTPYHFDMCFIGIPVSHKHSSCEKVFKRDIANMFDVYSTLMKHL